MKMDEVLYSIAEKVRQRRAVKGMPSARAVSNVLCRV